MTSECSNSVLYFSIPTCMREWISARKVWDSTAGKSAFNQASNLRRPPRRRRQAGIEGHQRIEAEQQIESLLQGDRGVHGFAQSAVHKIAPVDLHRRIQTRQRRAGLHRPGNRHPVITRRTKFHRFAGIQIDRHHIQLVRQLAEIVGAARRAPHPGQVFVNRLVVENAGRQRLAQPGQRLQEARIQRILQIAPAGFPQQFRHRQQPPPIFAKGRRQENLRIERVFFGFIADERMADLPDFHLVGQQRGDYRAGADADVHVEAVEIDALQRLVERAQRADFVNQPHRSAAGNRQADAGTAGLTLNAFRLSDEHVASVNISGQ